MPNMGLRALVREQKRRGEFTEWVLERNSGNP